MERFAPIAQGRVIKASRVAQNRGIPTCQPNFAAMRAQNANRLQYTDDERKNMVKWTEKWGPCEARRQWIRQYGAAHVPNVSTFKRNFDKFNDKGMVQNQNRYVVKPRTVRTPEKIEEVRAALLAEHDNPAAMLGSSQARNNFGISATSFSRITREDLKFNAYKKGRVHKHNPITDPQARVIYCEWLLQKFEEDPNFHERMIMTDECTFTLGGHVNPQTNRRYSAQREGRPKDFHTCQHEDQRKLHVWMGVCGNGVKIPIKFIRGTLDGEGYRQMLIHHVMPFIRDAFPEPVRETLYWQQDGAPVHRTMAVKNYLRSQFANRTIGLGFNDPIRGFYGVDYPPRSPDLTVLDFWLNNRVKSHVYCHPMPQNFEELEAKIIAVYEAITPEEIQNAFKGIQKKLRKCLHYNGGIIESQPDIPEL